MAWRLGLDLGTNSLGWAAVRLENGKAVALNDAGVRIFSDGRNPKDKQSNAVKRREPRSARRNRDRSKNRQARLMRELIAAGLMPEDEAARKALEGGKGIAQIEYDPWILRTRALDEQITMHQLGRVIFHLSQRRGFKSNRKTDRASNEKGKVNEAIERTKADLAKNDARTLGEFFGRKRLNVAQDNLKTVRGRRQPQPLARVRKSGDGSKWQYDYYPTRDLILDEFDQIWQSQSRFHGNALTDDAKQIIRETLAFQWPLKPQPVGRCTFLPDEERAAKALPISQRFRIYQEVNALRIRTVGETERPLTLEQRNKLVDRLLHPTNKTGKLTFNQIRKLLNLSSYDAISIESDKRQDMDGDKTTAILMQAERWGTGWHDLGTKTRNDIVRRLLEEEKEDVLINWLCQEYGFDKAQAEQIADAPIPDGHGRLSVAAMERILPHMEKDVVLYSEAATLEFKSHSNFATGEVFDEKLPYYGQILERSVAFSTGNQDDIDEKRYGKIANPTVHVALNQVRAVVNDLIRRFGAPEQIIVEVARDLPLSAKGKSELEANQAKNQKENERRAKELERLGLVNTYENRLRLRLYEEMPGLEKTCVFTGETISVDNLFSAEVEIEHLLPKARTLDDSFANLVLCKRRANRDKGNKSPHEAFSRSPAGYDWDAVLARVQDLPRNKHWRFGEDAMEKFADEANFLERQLNDTRYIARLAKGYLDAIYGGAAVKGGTNPVWVVPGRLTSDLRYHWGLDNVLRGHNEDVAEAQKKNRNDHRHHAIVVALTDRSLVKKAADAAGRAEDRALRLFEKMPEPWANFREDVRDTINRIVVSHKPDHGFQGAMHNDTAYGIPKGKEGEPDKKGVRTVVTRKPLDGGFAKPEDLQKIRDYDIKIALLEATQGLSGAEFKAVLIKAGEAMVPPVRRVRTIENLNVIAIADRKTGQLYKAYKGDSNYCYDIWQGDKGKWTGEVVSTFEAYQRAQTDAEWWRKPVNGEGQHLIMRLRKNDMLEIEHDGRLMIVQVYKFSEGRIHMAEHHEANVSNRIKTLKTLSDIQMAPSVLQKSCAKRVTVSPSGVVKRIT
jgi:CRISPR-associated endonuclease Csn1